MIEGRLEELDSWPRKLGPFLVEPGSGTVRLRTRAREVVLDLAEVQLLAAGAEATQAETLAAAAAEAARQEAALLEAMGGSR